MASENEGVQDIENEEDEEEEDEDEIEDVESGIASNGDVRNIYIVLLVLLNKLHCIL